MKFSSFSADSWASSSSTSSSRETILAIVSYSLCSSTLLLANKLAISYFPRPSLISLIQILVSLLIMFILFIFFKIPYDHLDYNKIQKYSIYVLAFTISRYANMKALEQSNIETVIIFRSCVPLTISIIEYYWMNRLFPSYKSFISLIVISLSAVIYCYTDSQFLLYGFSSYSWVLLYFVLLTFEMTYCKVLTSSAKMKTNWGPVYYCNLLAVVPMTILSYIVGDLKEGLWIDIRNVSYPGMVIIIFSCIVGTFIGYTSWLCVNAISATSYALVGVLNKFLTLFLNILLWDKHASPLGFIAVCISLCAGTFYEQAPPRQKPN